MRFLRKDNIKKTILVFSDLHLGAGEFLNGKRNFLEDFHYDKELIEFLEFYSSGEYIHREVELVINGDFIDFLSVPFVEFFDDEFWSEKASNEKLKLCLAGHPEVMEALSKFVSSKKRSITYIIGNHDAEFIFESSRQIFMGIFNEIDRERVRFHLEEEYNPDPEIMIKHGHNYELAHQFDLNESLLEASSGEKYFLAPWGSYYVTRIINKFKQERNHINAVKPIRNFLIHGIIFDTVFTLRFMFSNAYYFIMVRVIHFITSTKKFREVINYTKKELELLQDTESMVEDFFDTHPLVKTLIIGHTHEAEFKVFPQGNIFINTGTWTKMHNLDFSKKQSGARLTYAQIDLSEKGPDANLKEWIGPRNLPFSEFD